MATSIVSSGASNASNTVSLWRSILAGHSARGRLSITETVSGMITVLRTWSCGLVGSLMDAASRTWWSSLRKFSPATDEHIGTRLMEYLA